MTILDDLLKTITEKDFDLKMKQICDKILEEEKLKIKDEYVIVQFYNLLKVPNLFLAVNCSSQTRNPSEISFLCLERENVGEYKITVWSKFDTSPIKRVNVWSQIKTTENNLIFLFAKQLKLINGIKK